MLYSVELRLRPVASEPAMEATGYHLYSLFLRLMEGANATLAARLHDDGGPKPFTLALLGRSVRVHADGAAGLGARIRLRLTFLQEDVFASLVDAVWRLPQDAVMPLGNISVACDGLATTPLQSSWADLTSFEELQEGAGEERKLRLLFLSPTTFRSKGERNILFPEPSLVFGSLLSRWNAFASPSTRLELDKAALSHIRMSGYRLATRMMDFGSYQELGFCDQATYELDDGLPADEVRALHALGAFAFFGGVGAKATMGMGQARRLDNASSLSHGARGHIEKGRRPSPGD